MTVLDKIRRKVCELIYRPTDIIRGTNSRRQVGQRKPPPGTHAQMDELVETIMPLAAVGWAAEA